MCDATQGEPGHLVIYMQNVHGGESKISITCPFVGCNCSTTRMNAWKTHNSRMHNKKKESKLTYANRGEMFDTDVEEDVELQNNEHVDNDFKFKTFVAKKTNVFRIKKGN